MSEVGQPKKNNLFNIFISKKFNPKVRNERKWGFQENVQQKWYSALYTTVKPLLSGHLWDLPKWFVKIVQCLLMINIQWLLCTVIKLHVVKEAIQSSSSLPLITNWILVQSTVY